MMPEIPPGVHRPRVAPPRGPWLGLVPALLVPALLVGGCSSRSASKPSFTLPAAVSSGTPTTEPAAVVVPDDSGVPGVVAYDTKGWPASSGAPDAGSLPHTHLPGPIVYSVTPPAGGDHNPVWMNCGVYPSPVPPERAVHNLEHGAIWITYRPDLPAADVSALRSLVAAQKDVVITIQGQSIDTKQRYIDLTPFPGLPAPIVLSAWAHQLSVQTTTDGRLQRFIDAFRVNPKYTPEYGASCDDQPPATGGRPLSS